MGATEKARRGLPVVPAAPPLTALQALNARIVRCAACPRLRQHCQRIARDKRAAYRDQPYWGRPVPNLLPDEGPIRLLIVGLAPGAHGANRTGRMFTGDRSGDFLFAALHAVGLANQPTSAAPGDGLALRGAAIAAAVHCAPPDNKPLPAEVAACEPYLTRTFDALPDLRAVVALGRLAFDATAREYRRRGWFAAADRPRFAHAAQSPARDGPDLFASYHPSQQNTFTRRLTQPMLRAVLQAARDHAGLAPDRPPGRLHPAG